MWVCSVRHEYKIQTHITISFQRCSRFFFQFIGAVCKYFIINTMPVINEKKNIMTWSYKRPSLTSFFSLGSVCNVTEKKREKNERFGFFSSLIAKKGIFRKTEETVL